MNANEFNPVQLTFAREKRLLTKQALADMVDVTVRSISLYESGEQEPSDITIDKLSQALEFPKAFFYLHDYLEEVEEDSISYRSKSKLRACDKKSANATAKLAIIMSDYVNTKVTLPKADIPRYSVTEKLLPESIAMNVRAEWGLGGHPIASMLDLLEGNGCRVFALPREINSVDAYCFYKGSDAFIVMNLEKSAERSRFDLAHELGHLVMHDGSYSNMSKKEEEEADSFASAFLMPKNELSPMIKSCPTFQSLLKIKSHWRVSLMALLYRCNRMGLISDWIYRRLVMEASAKGYRSGEPDSIAREYSKLWRRVKELLEQASINMTGDLLITQRDIAEMIDRLCPANNIVTLNLRQKELVKLGNQKPNVSSNNIIEFKQN